MLREWKMVRKIHGPLCDIARLPRGCLMRCSLQESVTSSEEEQWEINYYRPKAPRIQKGSPLRTSEDDPRIARNFEVHLFTNLRSSDWLIPQFEPLD